ncbi:MAG: DUF1080 domain-containing protein, partial [Candidatus Nealsonbacteria bacterium]|nr:DUF1080 domain-containing protein [Candidatus Nealsonbacteria bacterium]
MSQLPCVKPIVTAACLLAAVFSVSHAQDPATPPNDTAALVAVLKSDADVFDKATACQRLSIVGDESAVPALAALLADEKLSNYARCALEGIPGPAADVALREALTRLETPRLVGVLGSIGVRRDAAAVAPVTALLRSDDPAILTAAARALGHIGTTPAATALQEALARATPELGPAVGNACLICIQSLAKRGESAKALALCTAVEDADLPEHITSAATYQTILARGKDGLPRLAKLLDSDAEPRFRLALRAARQLGRDTGVASQLAADFKRHSAERQALLLIALADLGDKASLPTIVAAARTGQPEVRVEAIRAMAKLGDASVVPVLLDAATQSDERIAAAARGTLAVLESDTINGAIVKLLAGNDERTRRMAIDMAGQRQIASATSALFHLARSTRMTTRSAAIRALGSTTQIADLSQLIDLAVGSLGSKDFDAARAALQAACVRMPQEPCAEKLVAAMSGVSTPERVFLLEQLTLVGGTTALNTVVGMARANNDVMQDAATRLLGAWPSADAAPAMLALAKTLTNEKYKIRALRGYVRIARQLNMTPAARMAVCRNTLAIARRSDDRGLVFEVFKRYPTPEGLTLAVSLLDDKALRKQACSTIVSMAGVVAMKAPEPTEKALLRVIDLTTDAALTAEAKRQLAVAREFARQHREEAQFKPLFDGTNLDAWQCSPGVFRVEQGAIVGGNLEKAIGQGNDFACTKQPYGDFELRLQFKLLGNNPNGGVNVRSKRNAEDGIAAGYQADLGAGYWGCLYDEARRNRMLATADPKPTIRPDDWNDYRILCEGKRIQLWVNGVQTVDYTEQEPGIATAGIIALQIQASRPSEAWYRN